MCCVVAAAADDPVDLMEQFVKWAQRYRLTVADMLDDFNAFWDAASAGYTTLLPILVKLAHPSPLIAAEMQYAAARN